MDRLKPISLENIQTFSPKERPSKVRIDDFGKPWRTGGDVSPRIKSLLKILAGNDFRMVVNNILQAVCSGI
jgi:hypothetical protein